MDDIENMTKKLDDICNWNRLNNVAVEYHDLQGTIYISYEDLLVTKNMLSDYLKCIQDFEFIGINFDIPEYCIISLILGILSSKHSFVYIPSNVTELRNLKTTLHIHYLFSKQITTEGNIVYQFTIHNECIYLIKLKDIQKQIVQNREKNYYAYAILTSGSTGMSKIVKVPHSCIVPNILDLNRILAITEYDKIAQFTSFTFDPCIIEIFIALSNAGTLFMPSKSLKNNPNRLLKEAYSNRITILQITPSVFLHNWTSESLKTTILGSDTSLRVILFGGEPFPKADLLLEKKHSCNDTRMFNVYGITEVSCWASINEITITSVQFDIHCLGQALSQTMFQVKNERGEILTKGTGFLHIGSNKRVCVVNDENIEDFELPVFRDSGDIVNIDEEGKIFYKGRRNSIIKRFGNKVDLTKMEEFTLQVHSIKICYVLWDENYHKLYLCLVLKENVTNYSDVNAEVMKHLHSLDPLYRPDKIHFLEHVEFTSNGKISIEFLRENCRQEQITNGTLDNINFQKVEDIFKFSWRNNLKCENDGFVKSGGTSVVALQISNTVSETLNLDFPELIGMLLMDATVNECLSYIKTTILNSHRNKVINNSKCHYSDSQILPLVKSVTTEYRRTTNLNAEEQDSDLMNVTDQMYICQWYKCRGQLYRNVPIADKRDKIQCNKISKIEIIKTYDLHKCVDASPTLFQCSDGKTYATVGSHSGFICTIELGNQNYTSTFEVKLPDRIEASVLVLDNFRGVVGCYNGNVYCIHLKTGEIIWKYQTGDVVKCSAIFCKKQEAVFVGSYDCYIYCLSAKDGTEIWKVKSSNGSISASGCLHSPTNSVLFATLDGSCLAVRQWSGEIMWKHKLVDPIFVAPVILNSGLVLFCSVTGKLFCFDIEVNVKMWEYKIDGNVFAYIVKQNDAFSEYESIIVASQNKNIYCLQSKDPSFKTEPLLKYTLNFHSPIFATPWCENNFLFVACTDGTLNIYNFIKDKLIKSEKLPGEVFSSPVVDNDIAIIGCRDNSIYVLKFV